MTITETLEERRAEFESHVWNHAEDPFQTSFDVRYPLNPGQFVLLESVIKHLRYRHSDEKISSAIRKEMESDPSIVFIIMQIVGLTRSKILQDLRGSLANTSTTVPSSADKLHLKDNVWSIAGPYLSKRLRIVLMPIASLPHDQLYRALESLNQATWPGWIRQERAKRSGHEAEHRLASLFAALKLPFSPIQKADNPLCRDAMVNGLSYDLVVPDESNPVLCFKATVHTANIGQYGESKDALEVAEAIESLKQMTNVPLLMTLIDGVGFQSNRDGLDTVLERANEFCQFDTLWKAAVVAAHRLCRRLILILPDHAQHLKFLQRYDYAVSLESDDFSRQDFIQAGEASLRMMC